MNKSANRYAVRAVAAATVFACAALLVGLAAQSKASRRALEHIVDDLCVPGQMQSQDPKPCVEVDLSGGVEKGFAILKDLRELPSFC